MDQQSREETIKKRVLWTVAAVAVLAVLFVINRLFIHHPLWDWIKLLIVPAILAGGGLWFNTQQRAREQRIARERAQDDALQAYLDGMSQLLTDKERPLNKAQPGDRLSTVARARTLTVLARLDSGRKRSVLEFLYESRLIDQEYPFLDESDLIERHPTIVRLQQADLSGANLVGTDLSTAALSGADLNGADLTGADLNGADLDGADLSGALLSGALLSWANLRWANLRWADLSGARLMRTDLYWADLSGALLSGTGVTDEQLEQAKSLEGATMPNGQKYEDWLKDREGRKEDAENE